jgi:hypothetical protein
MANRGMLVQLVIGILLIILLYGYIATRLNLGEGEFMVEDPGGDRLIIEVAPGLDAIDDLLDMHRSGGTRWVGGRIERYDNRFGFRFDPETIVVANFTAEGLQAVFFETIQNNFTYWQGLGHVYIEGRVVKAPA